MELYTKKGGGGGEERDMYKLRLSYKCVCGGGVYWHVEMVGKEVWLL